MRPPAEDDVRSGPAGMAVCIVSFVGTYTSFRERLVDAIYYLVITSNPLSRMGDYPTSAQSRAVGFTLAGPFAGQITRR
jgi:hypothetical protein